MTPPIAAPDISPTEQRADDAGADAERDALDGVVPLGHHTLFELPGVVATLRRWRYRGQSRVELVIVGIPTDADGSSRRDQLLRVRARVLSAFLSRGMYVFGTERKHDTVLPRMTLIDRLK
ncbi:hypothetical protein ACFOYW_07805 [Gryllotalpicola reticulitermitis]|uniref:Uncharacterized protein n=1 Tax=Gryllotalpicola reticulitermitis TaxID=1184153 RepID=A0ABV8Q725_9MICO